uniref:Uncharacterized protein n=1 Tax=mine drainage metagenome TaxID=410659 RepID=E6Q9Y4_9ZZZZ
MLPPLQSIGIPALVVMLVIGHAFRKPFSSLVRAAMSAGVFRCGDSPCPASVFGLASRSPLALSEGREVRRWQDAAPKSGGSAG